MGRNNKSTFFTSMAELLNGAVEKFANAKILRSHRQTFNMSDGSKIRVTITKLKTTQKETNEKS